MKPMMRVLTTVLAVGLAPVPRLAAQDAAARFTTLTRAERSGFEETSRYADVMEFTRAVVDADPHMFLMSLGYTMEGRKLPVVVVGDVTDGGPESVLASGKLRMYVQADIHAGEVCGKEAMLMLLRDLANGAHAEWLDSLVLLIAPIYNADGNERVRLTNRRYQNGPIAGMGQRANAQGLDLNRDGMKIDAPETRSLISFWKRYDPQIMMDLHTTDGPRAAYYLTYAPPLHPNTDPGLVELLRGGLLPAVTAAVTAEYGWDFYYYGFVPWRGMKAERGWYTFSHQPRFLTNYYGMRNRIGLLSEAYSYATFEDRIRATRRFVEEVADYAYHHASEIKRAVEAADAADIVGTEMALRATYGPGVPADILMGEVEEVRNPYSGLPMLNRLDVSRPERMPEFGTFRATATETVPAEYLVPADLKNVLDVLDDHGVRWERLKKDETMTVERFVIDSTRVADEYQGHQQRTFYGSYESVSLTVPAATAVVPLDQPLGRLVFLLLEPRSDDGLANWNYLDEATKDAEYYPILRVMGK